MATATKPSTELVPVEKIATDLQAITEKYGPGALATVAAAAKCFQLAEGVRQTRDLVRVALPHVRHLMGSRLGFLTDRDPGKTDKPPYPDNVIVECLTEALLKGARWTDNEINVLFGSVHYTLAYWRRIVAELPDLTDLDVSTGIPKMFDGGATVGIGAKFKLAGNAVEMRREFTVRLTSGMGADGAIGKATRRMLAAVHHRVTGSQQSADTAAGADDPTDVPQPSKTQQLADRMASAPRQVETTPAPNGHGEQTADTPEDIAGSDRKLSAIISRKGQSLPACLDWINKDFDLAEGYEDGVTLAQIEPLHRNALAKHLLTLADAGK